MCLKLYLLGIKICYFFDYALSYIKENNRAIILGLLFFTLYLKVCI
jgi:hypothetical protein